jgi:hypothetical protein
MCPATFDLCVIDGRMHDSAPALQPYRAIVLSNTCYDPLRDTALATLELCVDVYLSRPQKPLSAAPVDNEEALIAFRTIRSDSGVFERMRWSVVRCVEACTEYHGGAIDIELVCAYTSSHIRLLGVALNQLSTDRFYLQRT